MPNYETFQYALMEYIKYIRVKVGQDFTNNPDMHQHMSLKTIAAVREAAKDKPDFGPWEGK